jgi:hypothetical protein
MRAQLRASKGTWAAALHGQGESSTNKTFLVYPFEPYCYRAITWSHQTSRPRHVSSVGAAPLTGLYTLCDVCFELTVVVPILQQQ